MTSLQARRVVIRHEEGKVAVIHNTKGTSHSSFRIGKGGATLRGDSTTPPSAANSGDFLFDAVSGSLKVKSGVLNEWENLSFDDLIIEGSTLYSKSGSSSITISDGVNLNPGTGTVNVSGSRVLTVSDNIDADTVGGLVASKFVRTDIDSTMLGSLSIGGDLTVTGTMNVVQKEISTGESIFVLNTDWPDDTVPTEPSGFFVYRGNNTYTTGLIWNEATDEWIINNRTGVAPNDPNFPISGAGTTVQNYTLWHSGNFTPSGKLDITGTADNSTRLNGQLSSFYTDASNLSTGTLDTARLPSVSSYIGYTPVQQGGGIGQSAGKIYLGWSAASKVKVTVDTTDLGNIATEAWALAQFPSITSLNDISTGHFLTTGGGGISGVNDVSSISSTPLLSAQHGTQIGIANAYDIGIPGSAAQSVCTLVLNSHSSTIGNGSQIAYFGTETYIRQATGNSTWTAWKKYVYTDGGTFTGNVSIETPTSPTMTVRDLANSSSSMVALYAMADSTGANRGICGFNGDGTLKLLSTLPVSISGGGSKIDITDTSVAISGSSSSAQVDLLNSTGTYLGGVMSTSASTIIKGTSAANSIVIASSDNITIGASGAVFIDNANKRLGIDTSSPAYKLDVDQKSSETWAQIRTINSSANGSGDAGSAAGFEAIGARGDNNATYYGRMGLGFRRTNGTAISSGTTVGGVLFGGQWGTDQTYQAAKVAYAASIRGNADGNWTSNTVMPTGIDFYTGTVGDDLRAANVTYGTLRLRLTSGGNLLLGTTTDQGSKLNVAGNVNATSFSGDGSAVTGLSASNISSGTIADARLPSTMTSKTFSGAVTATSFNATSSRRFKSNIETLDYDNLARVLKLRPVSYVLNGVNKLEVGLIAEEVVEHVPEVVGINSFGEATGVDYGRLVSMLLGVVKDQEERIRKLEATIGAQSVC